ncbi:MAG: NifU family protein [Actinomycetota bacterium]|jgi:Fe/S biogenesis protein NfuA|nr:NifU family protein [Actinomycetota bacterium]
MPVETTPSATTPTAPAPLRVTAAARQVVLETRAAEPGGDELALRVEVVGEGASDYLYELTFAPLSEAVAGDALGYSEALPVLVPEPSVAKLRGATLDHVEPTGLVLRNPNRPRPTIGAGSGATLVLEGSVEERLQQLLDGEINPMLAMHGGFAALDRIEGDTAFMTMGGGCQGCGLAQLTLTEGIKATVEDRIPEIANVVDITDHAAGDNPFYQPDQK